MESRRMNVVIGSKYWQLIWF